MEARIDEVIKEACEIQGAGIVEGREDVDILIIEFRSIGWRAERERHLLGY